MALPFFYLKETSKSSFLLSKLTKWSASDTSTTSGSSTTEKSLQSAAVMMTGIPIQDFSTKASINGSNKSVWQTMSKQIRTSELTIISAPPAHGASTAALCLGLAQAPPYTFVSTENTKATIEFRMFGLMKGLSHTQLFGQQISSDQLTEEEKAKLIQNNIISNGVFSKDDVLAAINIAKRQCPEDPTLILDNVHRLDMSNGGIQISSQKNAHNLLVLKELAYLHQVKLIVIVPTARSHSTNEKPTPADILFADRDRVNHKYIIVRRVYPTGADCEPETNLIMGQNRSGSVHYYEAVA